MSLESKVGLLSRMGNKIRGSVTSKILAYSLMGSLAFGSALYGCGDGGGGGPKEMRFVCKFNSGHCSYPQNTSCDGAYKTDPRCEGFDYYTTSCIDLNNKKTECKYNFTYCKLTYGCDTTHYCNIVDDSSVVLAGDSCD